MNLIQITILKRIIRASMELQNTLIVGSMLIPRSALISLALTHSQQIQGCVKEIVNQLPDEGGADCDINGG